MYTCVVGGKRDVKDNGVGYRCGHQRYAEVTYMM